MDAQRLQNDVQSARISVLKDHCRNECYREGEEVKRHQPRHAPYHEPMARKTLNFKVIVADHVARKCKEEAEDEPCVVYQFEQHSAIAEKMFSVVMSNYNYSSEKAENV